MYMYMYRYIYIYIYAPPLRLRGASTLGPLGKQKMDGKWGMAQCV